MVNDIVAIIQSSRTFLVTSHVRLDGDALGSELALSHMLRRLGKEVVVCNQDETPAIYRFLPGTDAIVHALNPGDRFDAAFILDCSDLDRVGDHAAAIGSVTQTIVNIDHHISNDRFAEYSLVDHGASSTGEIICRLLEPLEVPLTGDIATNLYTAIMTDTGSFRYSNTSSATLRLAARLVDGGADVRDIAERVYESRPLAQIRLMGMALDTLELHEAGTIGSVTVTQEMLHRAGALPEHTEGIVDLVRSVNGTEIALFYCEMADNDFKVSFRSKGDADVARVAGAFGGGGHVNAAACRIEGDLTTVKKRLMDVIAMVRETASSKGQR